MADLTTTKGASEELKRRYDAVGNASYDSKYANDIAAAVDSIKNTEGFSYDSDTDASYQAAKKQYEKSAKKNMKNTLAQSSAMTGGYANSWGQTAAQQVYDDTMSEVFASLLPQYEAQAYSRHRDAVNDNYNKVSLLQSLDDNAYGRYADKLANDQALLSLAASMYDNNKNFERSVLESDRNYQYQLERDAVEDSKWQQEMDLASQKSSASSGSSTGSSSRASSGYTSDDEYEYEETVLDDGLYSRYLNTASALEGEGLYKYINNLYASGVGMNDIYNILYDVGVSDPEAFIDAEGKTQPNAEDMKEQLRNYIRDRIPFLS